ncbi:hypothetical protein JHL18_02035 [Clostridium sp. YIM B02505]|uniref:Uncharacterized protein n=1 Tax=Clostridium yunnanense TaxID=2800325 RepID=A0ABS1EJ82_9CLOT|nr:hypothetical protein [Clostridium yunnanense]MBK1809427.1 hypothetical protein [Clostridium yunnanense]
MLKVNKNITLSGISEVNGVQVVYMSAVISTDGANNENVSKSISNQDLYIKNKAEVRADMVAFEQEVYKVQDGLVGGGTNEQQ